MPDLAPEARARERIDALLTAAGWTLQNYDRFDSTVARFIALREIPVKGGRQTVDQRRDLCGSGAPHENLCVLCASVADLLRGSVDDQPRPTPSASATRLM